MKTRVTVLIASALAVGAIAAPVADAKVCQTANDTANRHQAPTLNDVDETLGIGLATACAAAGG